MATGRETAMTKRLSRLETASVLSVIIPGYNKAQTIGRILQQVVEAVPQTPKQIVIVDNCSTDGTSEWLRRNLAHSDGIWRRVSLNDKGDLVLSRPMACKTKASFGSPFCSTSTIEAKVRLYEPGSPQGQVSGAISGQRLPLNRAMSARGSEIGLSAPRR
jgi:glycosyltransferase involved in cell wall biosynthesis